jgi:hypothetical protein
MAIEQPKTNNGGYKTHGDGLMRSQWDLVGFATKGVVSSIVNKKRMNMKSDNQRKKTYSLFKRRHADYQSRFQALANLAALGFFILFFMALIAIFGFPSHER